MYNKLFDVLYSFEVSEDVKSLIVENLQTQLNEELHEDSYNVKFIKTLLDTDISEEALFETLEIAYNSLNEAEIEDLTEEFMVSLVEAYINEFKFYGDPRPIGLTGVKKANEPKPEEQPKEQKPSAMDKLKSAVGKVKSWVDKVREINKPFTLTGIDKLKAKKDAIIKNSAEMGTVKAPEDKAKATLKPKATKPKATKPKATKQNKTKVNKVEPKAEVKPEVKPEQPKLEVEEPKKPVTASKTKTSSTKAPKKTPTKKVDSVAKKVAKAVNPKKKKTTAKKGRKPKNTNEAIADVFCVLANTNISESAIEEIVEMISNKKAAKKAVEKEYKEFSKAVDALNKAEVLASKGVVVDPEVHDKLTKKAEKQGERYEHFKALADAKFGS